MGEREIRAITPAPYRPKANARANGGLLHRGGLLDRSGLLGGRGARCRHSGGGEGQARAVFKTLLRIRKPPKVTWNTFGVFA